MSGRYAIVRSVFNADVTEKLLAGAVARLKEHGVDADNIIAIDVPGAVEIPLVAQLLAKTRHYSAIICLGAVIRGETSHYDYVCQQVSSGCQKVMLEYELPVIFGVLTTENDEQALERVGGKHGHKGIEAADAAVAMVKVVGQLI